MDHNSSSVSWKSWASYIPYIPLLLLMLFPCSRLWLCGLRQSFSRTESSNSTKSQWCTGTDGKGKGIVPCLFLQGVVSTKVQFKASRVVKNCEVDGQGLSAVLFGCLARQSGPGAHWAPLATRGRWYSESVWQVALSTVSFHQVL